MRSMTIYCHDDLYDQHLWSALMGLHGASHALCDSMALIEDMLYITILWFVDLGTGQTQRLFRRGHKGGFAQYLRQRLCEPRWILNLPPWLLCLYYFKLCGIELSPIALPCITSAAAVIVMRSWTIIPVTWSQIPLWTPPGSHGFTVLIWRFPVNIT